MSFISDTDHVTLGEGVYNNIHGNLNNVTNNHFYYGRKRRWVEIEDAPEFPLMDREPQRRRREELDGVKVIRNKHINLITEIRSTPGFFIHTGEAKGRAVIVKVFNRSPTAREELQSTVALAKGLMHPNILRIKGVSSAASFSHFIVYEDAFWKTAEVPLAAALKRDLTKSVTLGFKMIAGLSSGMNYLTGQGIYLGVENLDIFLDIDDRFLISINPDQGYTSEARQHEDTTESWAVFNALCQKVLRSANRVLHTDEIERNPGVLDLARQIATPQEAFEPTTLFPSTDSVLPRTMPEGTLPPQPRREYVWRTIELGEQSLATVAHRISLDLEMTLSSLNTLVWTDGQSTHRCAGYIREEITLAPTTRDSAVVSHDTPGPREVCSVCHEVVGLNEALWCICGDPSPGLQPTVKCPTCKFWSHRDCVGNLSTDTCLFCRLANGVEGPPRPSPGPQSHIDLQKDFIKPQAQPSLPNPSLPRKKKSQSTSKAKKGRMQDSGSVNYDKQCGVINDKFLPCSRSLACKIHTLEAKRAVQGRSTKYYDLVLEWYKNHRVVTPRILNPHKDSNCCSACGMSFTTQSLLFHHKDEECVYRRHDMYYSYATGRDLAHYPSLFTQTIR
ncbi:SCA7, zinc-binding domain-containing protein [Mycena leptocephala]|nr:SCA7, zinc-binding domain-containing protein [Mycena leptocephala]